MTLRRLLFAAYFFEVGFLLIVLPWTTLWDRNYLFDALPQLRTWLLSPYLRGAVSGLGLFNLGLGIAETAGAVGAGSTTSSTSGDHAGLAPPIQ